MQNALWLSAVLSLYPEQLTRKSLSVPVLLMFPIVIASVASRTAILSSSILTLIDAFSALLIFAAFVRWISRWRLSKLLVAGFFIHGCSQWIWRSLWFPPLVGTQIVTLLVFPVWRILLLVAWIKLISAMVDRPEASLQRAVTAIKQLKLPNPLNTFVVMVSSTVKDLKRERDAAEQAIIGLHLQCFRAEKMGTVSLSPREFCELMAKQCNLFILIIGEYYGHIIDPEGISVVESEYNVARDENPRKVLVFEKDGVERDKRLGDFLNSLRNYNDGYPTSSFTTPEELAEQIPPAVMLWLTKLAQQNNQEVRLP